MFMIRATLGDKLYEDYNVFSDRVQGALKQSGTKLTAADLKQIMRAVSWRVKSAPPVITKVHKPGKVKADPLHGLYEATVEGKSVIVEYEPNSELRDTEQVPLLEEGGIEAFVRREVLPDRRVPARASTVRGPGRNAPGLRRTPSPSCAGPLDGLPDQPTPGRTILHGP